MPYCGGGPAGLTAALYLARFRRNAVVFHNGDSRASWIPRTHNCPGFEEGISGTEFLARLTQQALKYGATINQARVDRLIRRSDGTFQAIVENKALAARTVLMATGIVDKLPPLPNIRQAIERGAVRLCPVCDAFEVRDRKIAILAPANEGVKHALFMRTYTRDLTLIAIPDSKRLSKVDSARLEGAAIALIEAHPSQIAVVENRVVVSSSGETIHHFDVLYPVLGCKVRTELVEPLEAPRNEIGELLVDEFQQTEIPGLYAAGDVVNGLNQISTATGQATIAATHIHNVLTANFA